MSTENPVSASADAAQVVVPAQEPSIPSPEVKQDVQSEQAPKTPEQEEMVPRKRVDRIRAALGESERQKQAMRDKIAELEKSIPKAAPVEPKLDDYVTPEDFHKDYAKYLREQEKAQESEKSKEPTPEKIAETAREYERKIQTFKTREAEHMKTNPEYVKAATVVNDFVAMMNTQHPAFKAFEEAVFGSEKAPQVIQFLGENPGEIARLARLGPVEVSMAMEDIIESLGAPKAAPVNSDEEPIETPPLPAPPKPVSVGSSKVKKHPDQMNAHELEKHLSGLLKRG